LLHFEQHHKNKYALKTEFLNNFVIFAKFCKKFLSRRWKLFKYCFYIILQLFYYQLLQNLEKGWIGYKGVGRKISRRVATRNRPKNSTFKPLQGEGVTEKRTK